ncbi:MAG: RelA/SpoT domain-containing protein, partial [Candidatus Dormibacteria bacterium]
MKEENGLLRAEIDGIGRRLRDGVASEKDIVALDGWRLQRALASVPVIAAVKHWTGGPVRVRPAKAITSIGAKLRRENLPLSRMNDISGCRVVVPDLPDQNYVVGQLGQKFPGSSLIDHRREPLDGYRAVHINVPTQAGAVEVQVRTRLQDEWAKASETAAHRFGRE